MPDTTHTVRRTFTFRLLLLSLVCLAILATSIVRAEESDELKDEDWYQIEFVIFKYNRVDRSVLRYEHQQPLVVEVQKFNYLWDKSDTSLTDNQLVQLPNEERILYDSVKRLERDPTAEVLQYSAWKQKLERDSEFYPIPIEAGRSYGDKKQLSGTVMFRRSRYIHIDVDLMLSSYKTLPFDNMQRWLLMPDDEAWPVDFLSVPLVFAHNGLLKEGSSQIPIRVIRMTQSRRIKESEVHYLDHPAIGVIATFKEVDAPFRFGISSFE